MFSSRRRTRLGIFHAFSAPRGLPRADDYWGIDGLRRLNTAEPRARAIRWGSCASPRWKVRDARLRSGVAAPGWLRLPARLSRMTPAMGGIFRDMPHSHRRGNDGMPVEGRGGSRADSIAIGLDLKQRKGAEHIQGRGRRSPVDVRAIDLRESGNAEQAQRPLNFVLD
jgi:hypothetical protein